MGDYALEFAHGWEAYFEKLDKSMRDRVWKKIQQLKKIESARHLRQGSDFYVSEIGQYRLCYKIDEKRRVKTIHFVGDHKEYEKWVGL
ncbi:MAG: type II toxin-antitoxin system HigB family toxin [Candidatus Micrarchaeota archaeon]|nr:type II toxin-antitoxin system HigB family toxin [Candidatus Micrarchaeota archaeon]